MSDARYDRPESWRDAFGPFEGRIWLNCAHQGPLPHVAVQACHEALKLKVMPSLLTEDLFSEVPHRVRNLLGRLVGVDADDIILGNSTSYGLHVLANGIPWRPGDEVLLVEGDYPADILPWLALENQGVRIRLLNPGYGGIDAEAVEAAFSSRTRLFCTTWVNSFTGYAIDLQAVGAECRTHGVLFVVNGSQAVGARPIDLATVPVDALVSCGYKWLCGPYATGFCWIRPDLRESLRLNQAYWLTMQGGRDLRRMRDYTLRDDLGARKYDVFCPANFLDMLPWAASLAYLLEQGIEDIARHDQALVGSLIEGLETMGYRVKSPSEEPARSTLVLIQHHDVHRTQEAHSILTDAAIDTALREGQIRFSPHLYNTIADVDRVLQVLEGI